MTFLVFWLGCLMWISFCCECSISEILAKNSVNLIYNSEIWCRIFMWKDRTANYWLVKNLWKNSFNFIKKSRQYYTLFVSRDEWNIDVLAWNTRIVLTSLFWHLNLRVVFLSICKCSIIWLSLSYNCGVLVFIALTKFS